MVDERSIHHSNDTNGWIIGRPLGKGGNGQVWEAQKGEVRGALKRLFSQKASSERRRRFKDEVRAMRNCAHIYGVLPVYDADLKCQRPWFVMPRATPLKEALAGETSLHKIVSAMHDIAGVLVRLHDSGVTHRDIKPENLFLCDGVWSVGDFGLATFDGKESKTRSGEKIGPIHYIAPEMLNEAIKSRGEPADVFSLAKTLWVLATGQNFALPGSYYSKYEVFRIGQYVGAERTRHLDMLVEACTAIVPESRPSMQHVLNELSAWLNPAVVEAASRMKIDIGEYASKLDNVQAETEAKNDRERDAYHKRRLVEQRLKTRYQPFITELEESLKQIKFSGVNVSYENGAKVTASIATPDNTVPSFSVALFTGISESIVSVSATVSFTRDHSFFSRLRIWSKGIQFVDGSSAEESQVAALLEYMKSQMSIWVNSALSIAFGPSTNLIEQGFLKNKVEVFDQNGNPIEGAKVAIIRADGLHQIETTNERGVVSPSYGPADPYIIFVAHSDYKSNTSSVASDTTRVVLVQKNNICSYLANTGWFPIPNVGDGIDLIIDGEKMYICCFKEMSINGGTSRPVYVEPGKAIRLRNSLGSEVDFTLTATFGTCVLFDVEVVGAQVS